MISALAPFVFAPFAFVPYVFVPAPRTDSESIAARFANFDQNGDGAAEIASVDLMYEAGSGARVLVLVEERLAHHDVGELSLVPSIVRLVDDLALEGYAASALSVELAPSALHQDGRYVLALRELLRAFDAEAELAGSELAGALLVGRFPDAFLVRTCNWRKKGDIELRRGSDAAALHRGVRYLRRIPEDVAHRADIVLADLDGRWEDVYVQPRTALPTVVGVFDGAVPADGGECVDLEERTVTYEDFFHVEDGGYRVEERADEESGSRRFVLVLDDADRDHECSDADRERPNPLPRPDVFVSRIDARGVAMRPRIDVVGADGRGLLDESGRPRRVEFANEDDVPHWREGLWEHDPALERRLLVEYFDLNHAYRSGAAPIAWRPASLACDLRSGYSRMARAADDWKSADGDRLDVHGRPTLLDVADWFAEPALLRTLRAHSDACGSVFARGKVAELDARLAAWSWTPKGAALVPSLAAACNGGKLDWFLARTLWENDAVAIEPSLYLHTGCHGVSPANAKKRAYDHPSYGLRQGAESILFFGRGLALVGRAKVFYDEPRGFAEELASGGTIGDAWTRYFDEESRASSWGEAGGDIGRKRSFFWSVLGDWTLTLAMGHPDRRSDGANASTASSE